MKRNQTETDDHYKEHDIKVITQSQRHNRNSSRHNQSNKSSHNLNLGVFNEDTYC